MRRQYSNSFTTMEQGDRHISYLSDTNNPSNYALSNTFIMSIYSMQYDTIAKIVYAIRRYIDQKRAEGHEIKIPKTRIDLRRKLSKEIENIIKYLSDFAQLNQITEKELLEILEIDGINISTGIDSKKKQAYSFIYNTICNILESYGYYSIIDKLDYFINVLAIEAATGISITNAPLVIGLTGPSGSGKSYFVNVLKEIGAFLGIKVKLDKKTLEKYKSESYYRDLLGKICDCGSNTNRVLHFTKEYISKYLRTKDFEAGVHIDDYHSLSDAIQEPNTITFIEYPSKISMLYDASAFSICDFIVDFKDVGESDKLVIMNRILEKMPYLTEEDKQAIRREIMQKQFVTRLDLVKAVEQNMLEIITRKLSNNNS